MHIVWGRPMFKVVAAVAFLTLSTVSVADCQSVRLAIAADIPGSKAEALLRAMVAACKSQEPDQFFALQTTDSAKLTMSASPARKAEVLADYCTFTNDAMKRLGGEFSAATHSIGPYKGKTKCGVPWSYWFVHNRSGELVLRLEVAVESGRLKIDTQ